MLVTTNISYAIVVEASLSFLGVGAPPTSPRGAACSTAGHAGLETAPWMIFFPGVAISLAVFALNLLGDSIRDLTDPRLARRPGSTQPRHSQRSDTDDE